MSDISKWKLLKQFIEYKIKEPWKHPSYVIYFFIVIVILGSIGFHYELFQCPIDIEGITINAANIFVALIASSTIELMLVRGKDEKFSPIRTDIQVFAISILIIGFILWSIIINHKEEYLGLILSILGLLLAYFTWWISNADNQKIIGNVNADKTIGGNQGEIKKEVLKGDTDGFKTE
ncbi:hypothetical protein [Saccharicrinis sp. 156]|uniref:hypothetical protein n=1 Tax=Saccharicrinis sp. 156 TaxID=3417574 RepID=UPI003D32F48D